MAECTNSQLDLKPEPLHGAIARMQALDRIFGDLVLLDEIMLHARLARGLQDFREIERPESDLAECVG